MIKHTGKNKLSIGILAASFFAVPLLNGYAAEMTGSSFGVLGAVAIQSPSYSHDGDSTTVDGKTSYGGGVTLEQRFSPRLSLEEDLLYLNRSFSRKTADFFGTDVNSTVTSGYLHVPVMVRFRPIPILSLGAGGYYSRTISTWTVSAEGFGSRTADYGKDDFGYTVAAGAGVPMAKNLSVVADLRYSRSLTDNARDSNDDLKFSDIRFLAGIRFDF
jgi:opacity protein-like surface antigen